MVPFIALVIIDSYSESPSEPHDAFLFVLWVIGVQPRAHFLGLALRRAELAAGDALDRFIAFLESSRTLRPADSVVDHTVAAIRADPGQAIGDLAAQAGVSHRTLISRFRAATGVTPKAYAQLWRFHAFVGAVVDPSRSPDWAGLATASGFYDQPHVIRAFRRFTGWTPAEYYRRVVEFGAEAASFVPLEDLPIGED